MKTLRTIRSSLCLEIPKVKGSRFLATAMPTATADEASAFVAAQSETYRDATHNCFAWRLADPDAFRSSDDGEPSGTAGRPILQEIDRHALVGVAVVVTRYYGGTKLGTGGLIRAYGAAAGAVLDAAELVEKPIVTQLSVDFAYGLDGPVRGVLNRYAIEVTEADYGSQIVLTMAVPVDEVAAVRHALVEATAGQANVRIS